MIVGIELDPLNCFAIPHLVRWSVWWSHWPTSVRTMCGLSPHAAHCFGWVGGPVLALPPSGSSLAPEAVRLEPTVAEFRAFGASRGRSLLPLARAKGDWDPVGGRLKEVG